MQVKEKKFLNKLPVPVPGSMIGRNTTLTYQLRKRNGINQGDSHTSVFESSSTHSSFLAVKMSNPQAKDLQLQRPSAHRGKSSEKNQRPGQVLWNLVNKLRSRARVTSCLDDAANPMPLTWRRGNRAVTTLLQKRRYDNGRGVTL